MEATGSSETSADIQRTTRRYIPEDRTLHNDRCENFKSYMFLSVPPNYYMMTYCSSKPQELINNTERGMSL
jgi:hypothetical protein